MSREFKVGDLVWMDTFLGYVRGQIVKIDSGVHIIIRRRDGSLTICDKHELSYYAPFRLIGDIDDKLSEV